MVPSLEIQGRLLTESMAIIEFIEVVYKMDGQRLLPDCPFERAEVRRLCEIVNAGIQPIQNSNVVKRIKQEGGDGDKWTSDAISKGFDTFEKYLE